MRQRLVLLAASVLTFGTQMTRADSSVRVLETQPAASATLGHGQNFWLLIEYETAEPISLWARPYHNGNEIGKALSNASLIHVGSGRALGWFSLAEPGEVDEIRIKAGGGQPYREWELMRLPVRLRWTAAASAAEPPAAWVEKALATEKLRYADEARRRADEPVVRDATALYSGFMLAVLALLVAGITVPLWSIWRWRGRWRIAAAVPVCAMLFVVLRIVVDTAHDPTSHTLWPFEILQIGVVSITIIGALKLARALVRPQT
jgi:hypothetical protein